MSLIVTRFGTVQAEDFNVMLAVKKGSYKMRRKWFYVDIDETRHLRVAVKADDGDMAKQYVDDLLHRGSIEMCEAADNPYGRETQSITLGDPEPKRPPKGMLRFREVSFGEVERVN